MPNHHRGYKISENRDMTRKIRVMRMEYYKTLNKKAAEAFDNLQRFIKGLTPPVTETTVQNIRIITDNRTGHIEKFRLCSTCREYKIYNSLPELYVDCDDCRDVIAMQKLSIMEEVEKDMSDIEESDSDLDVCLIFRKSNYFYA